MTKVKLYNLTGKKESTMDVDEEIIAQNINRNLLSQAVNVQLANVRKSTAHTKDRSEVSGGGKKPWRQKGTGRARAGSSRSPIWIGGGVTFGPRKNRNYSKRLSKKMRQKAIFMAMSCHNKDKTLIIVDKLEDLGKASTKAAEKLLGNFPIVDRSILVILDENYKNLVISLRNIPYAKTLSINNLNVFDILKYDLVIIPKNIISKIKAKK